MIRLLQQRAVWYSRIAAGRSRRAARTALTAAGIGLAREFVIVDCPDGDEASGLFSEVAAVLGCLAEVESHPRLYAGMRVDFRDHGLYYDAAMGPNWWEYFFEPLTLGSAGGATMRRLFDWEHDAFAETVESTMAREQAADVLRRHVRVRPSLIDKADRTWRSLAPPGDVIGVHYRGTDKWEGAPVVAPEAVEAAVREAALAFSAGWKVFVATDEEEFLEFMRKRFPGQVLALEMRRSTDGRPLHKAAGNGYRKGEEAMLDCLLLSRCARLVRTDSDLGLFATFFNADLPVRLLGTGT
jgi:hypothetical protein